MFPLPLDVWIPPPLQLVSEVEPCLLEVLWTVAPAMDAEPKADAVEECGGLVVLLPLLLPNGEAEKVTVATAGELALFTVDKEDVVLLLLLFAGFWEDCNCEFCLLGMAIL